MIGLPVVFFFQFVSRLVTVKEEDKFSVVVAAATGWSENSDENHLDFPDEFRRMKLFSAS